MTSQKQIQDQIDRLEADVKAQREEIRRTATGRNGVQSNLIPVVAANEERIAALKQQLIDSEQAEQERQKYLASPQAKRDLKELEEKVKELMDMNKRYYAEGEALYQKIQNMRKLDAELLAMRKRFDPAASPLMSGGDFAELVHVENGLLKAIEAAQFVARVHAMRKNK